MSESMMVVIPLSLIPFGIGLYLFIYRVNLLINGRRIEALMVAYKSSGSSGGVPVYEFTDQHGQKATATHFSGASKPGIGNKAKIIVAQKGNKKNEYRMMRNTYTWFLFPGLMMALGVGIVVLQLMADLKML